MQQTLDSLMDKTIEHEHEIFHFYVSCIFLITKCKTIELDNRTSFYGWLGRNLVDVYFIVFNQFSFLFKRYFQCILTYFRRHLFPFLSKKGITYLIVLWLLFIKILFLYSFSLYVVFLFHIHLHKSHLILKCEYLKVFNTVRALYM